jgi:hypothetical protein
MDTDMAQVLQRLDRFEQQLSEVRVAIIQMARTEERVSVVLEQNTVLFKKVDSLTEKVGTLEKENATHGQSIGVFERFVWVVITAAAGAVVWLFKP